MNRSAALRSIFWAALAVALSLSWAHELLPVPPFYRQIGANLSAAAFVVAIVASVFAWFRIFAPEGATNAVPGQSLFVRAGQRGGQIGLGLFLIYRWIEALCRIGASTQPVFDDSWLSEHVAWELSEALFQTSMMVIGIVLLGRQSGPRFLRPVKPVIALCGLVLLVIFSIVLFRLAIGNGELAPCRQASLHFKFIKQRDVPGDAKRFTDV